MATSPDSESTPGASGSDVPASPASAPYPSAPDPSAPDPSAPNPPAPRSSWRATPVADLAQAAVFAALIAALGLPGTITIGASGVPITLQTLGVMLAGAILGPRKGALAIIIFSVLAIAGLPILAGGRTGLTSLAAPTSGYFVAWLPAVLVIGVLTAMMMPRYRIIPGIAINLLGGVALIYLFGTVGLLLRTDMTLWAAISANGPFVIGDVAKAVIAGLVASQVHRGRPGLITPIRFGTAAR